MVWARALTCPHPIFRKIDPDVTTLTCLLITVALALLAQLPLGGLTFNSNAVMAGEWWRILTWPFVHVSLYHILLDGLSFVFLYQALAPLGAGRRSLIALSTMAGSLLAASFAPGFQDQGLCGLSGPAHGLMAVMGISMLRTGQSRFEWMAGGLTVTLVIAKATFEAIAGHVLLGPWHFGFVGLPNPYTHLGGVLAGISAWLLVANHKQSQTKRSLTERTEITERGDPRCPRFGEGPNRGQ